MPNLSMHEHHPSLLLSSLSLLLLSLLTGDAIL
jgi:hypothetical protein